MLPVDFGSTTVTGVSATAYYWLIKALSMDGSKTRVFDVVGQLAQLDEFVLEASHSDVIDIGRLFNLDDQDWKDFTLPSGINVQIPIWFQPVQRPEDSWDVYDSEGDVIATMPLGATFFDQTVFPYLDGYPSNYKDLSKAMAKVHWVQTGSQPLGPCRRA